MKDVNLNLNLCLLTFSAEGRRHPGRRAGKVKIHHHTLPPPAAAAAAATHKQNRCRLKPKHTAKTVVYSLKSTRNSTTTARFSHPSCANLRTGYFLLRLRHTSYPPALGFDGKQTITRPWQCQKLEARKREKWPTAKIKTPSVVWAYKDRHCPPPGCFLTSGNRQSRTKKTPTLETRDAKKAYSPRKKVQRVDTFSG